METLRGADFRQFAEFLQDLYALRELDSFLCHVTRAVSSLIETDTVTYNHLDPRRRHITWVQHPPNFIQDRLGPQYQEIADRYVREHPIVRHHKRARDHHAVQISDLLTRRRFHELAVYHEFFRPIGVEHQLSILLTISPSRVTGLCVSNHEREFSGRDRLILELVRPHLVQAYANAELVSRCLGGTGADRFGLIALGPCGTVREVSCRGEELLKKHFADRSASGRRLPEALDRWVQSQRSVLDCSDDAPQSLEPLVVTGAGGELVVRLCSGATRSLLILEERSENGSARRLGHPALTGRESEILSWVAEGKTNDEIGRVLEISVRTVAKHLESSFRKLGVETRTAAVRVVAEAGQTAERS